MANKNFSLSISSVVSGVVSDFSDTGTGTITDSPIDLSAITKWANYRFKLRGDEADSMDFSAYTDEVSHQIMILGSTSTPPVSDSFIVKTGTHSLRFKGVSGCYGTFSPHVNHIFGKNDFTIEAWVYPSDVTNLNMFLSAEYYGGFWIGFQSGKVYFHYNGAADVASQISVNINTWVHIALQRSGTTLALFINGTLDTAITGFTSEFASGGPIGFHLGTYSGGTESYLFNGYLDCLRIINGTCQYSMSGFTPPTDVLAKTDDTVLLLNFNHPTPTEQYSGKLIQTAGKTYVSNITQYNDFSWFFNKNSTDSKYLPGSQDYVFGTGDFTVECWVFIDYTSTGTGFLDFRTSDSNDLLLGFWPTTNNFNNNYYFSAYVNKTHHWADRHYVVAGHWYHLAVQRRSGVTFVLVDGEYSTSFSDNTNYTGGATQITIGGEHGAEQYFTGYIEGVRISKGIARYNVAQDIRPASKLTTDASTVLLANLTSYDYSDGFTGDVGETYNSGESTTFEAILSNVPTSGLTDVTGKTPTAIGGIAVSTNQVKFGTHSCYFDGTDDYLRYTANSSFNFLNTDSMTFEAWVYLDSSCNSQVPALFSKYTDNGTRSLCLSLLRVSSNATYVSYLKIEYWNSGGYNDLNVTLSRNVNINRFMHVAIVLDGVWKIFIDGELLGQTNNNLGYVDSNSDFVIGRSCHDGYPHYLKGYIDEVRISKGTAQYTNNFTVPSQAFTSDAYTVLLNHFDPEPGMTSQVTTSLIRGGNTICTPVISKLGIGSGYFDGNGDYVSTPVTSNFQLSNENFTVEGWIYPISFTNYQAILAIGRGGATAAETTLILQFNSSGQLGPLMTNALGNWNTNSIYFGTWATNEWQHFALVRNGTQFNLYRNGESIGNFTSSHTLITATNNVFIGAVDYNGSIIYYYNGFLDEIRISKGIARYTSNFTVSTSQFTWDNYTALLVHFDSSVTLPGFTSQNLLDVTKNGNVICLPTQKKFGYSSSYFDGSSSISIPNSNSFNFAAYDFTIEAWVYPTELNSEAIYVNSSSDFSMGLVFIGDKLQIFASSNGTQWDLLGNSYWVTATGAAFGLGSISITPNTWTHIAFSRQGNQWKSFINGQLDVNVTKSGSIVSRTDAKHIGLWGDGNNPFNGYIDEFRISKGIARYTENFTPPTQPFTWDNYTALLLHFDSLNTLDATGKQLIPVGSRPTFPSSLQLFNESCWYFDGTDDRITVSDPSFAFGTGDFTIEAWAYPTTSDRCQGILQISGTVGGLQANYTNNLALVFNPQFHTFRADSYYLSSTNYSVNTWYHVVLTRKSGITYTIVNSTVLDSVSDNVNYIGTNLVIGGFSSTSYLFIGFIRDVRLSNQAKYVDSLASYSVPTQRLTTDGATLFASLSTNNSSDETGNAMTLYGNASVSSTVKLFNTDTWYFDGTDDRILINNSNLELGFGDFTIECWTYCTSMNGNNQNGIFQLSDSTNGYQSWNSTGKTNLTLFYTSSSGNITLHIYQDRQNYYTRNTQYFPLNTWHHVVVQRKDQILYILADGNVIYSKVDNSYYNGQYLTIGSAINISYMYIGYIADFRITKSARYPVTNQIPTAKFIADANTHYLSNPSLTDLVPIITDVKSRYSGKSYYFDGSTIITIPYDTNFNWSDTNSTIECWVYADSWTNWSWNDGVRNIPVMIGNTYYNNTSNIWSFGPLSDGRLSLYYYDYAGAQKTVTSTTTLSTGQWNHIALVFTHEGGGNISDNRIKLYINGVEVASANKPDSINSAIYNLTIGGANNIKITGYIDELIITKNNNLAVGSLISGGAYNTNSYILWEHYNHFIAVAPTGGYGPNKWCSVYTLDSAGTDSDRGWINCAVMSTNSQYELYVSGFSGASYYLGGSPYIPSETEYVYIMGNKGSLPSGFTININASYDNLYGWTSNRVNGTLTQQKSFARQINHTNTGSIANVLKGAAYKARPIKRITK